MANPTIEFLQQIFQYAETGYTQIFALPTTKAKSVSVLDFNDVPAITQSFQGQNIYFSPGITGVVKNSKLNTDDIIGITALWADIDIYHPGAHAKQNLPRDVQEAMNLLPDNMPPSIVVHSGYGLNVWWLLKEPWYFDTPEEKSHAKDLLTRLQGYIRQQAQTNGWHLDSVPDLPRVMRLPGTLNVKISEHPVWAQVIESCDLRYDPSEIDELLPAVEQTASTEASTQLRTTAFERRPTDGPVSYMMQNCMFMQNWMLNYKTMSEPEWVAVISNAIRGIGGEEIILDTASAWLGEKYNHNKTIDKIKHVMDDFKGPLTCDYIRTSLGFQGCPNDKCDNMQAPCGWSLGKIPQARAILKNIPILTPEAANQPEVIGALAVLQREKSLEYESEIQRFQGTKSSLKSAITQHKKEQMQFAVIDGGGEPSANGERWLSQYVPDVPVDLIMPGNPSSSSYWEFKYAGVSAVKIIDKDNVTRTKATFTPIIINELITNIDTEQAKASICFKTRRGIWRNVILPKSTIFDAKRIMCLADAELNITTDMTKTLTKWLSELEAANTQNIPERLGVSKFGWRNNNTEFIIPGMNTNYALDTDEIAPQSVINGYMPAGDHNVWLQNMTEVIKSDIARFIISIAFTAPLLNIIGQRSFCVHNWGDSRDGKSAMQYIAMSVWGRPDNIKLLASSSETGIERRAALCSDLPLFISELETLDERQRAEFENKIPYMITEGKGKQRATVKGLQQGSSWRTVMLSNAESSIIKDNSKGGIITRILEIRGGAFSKDQEFASYLYSIVDKNYGHAGLIYLSNLISTNHPEMLTIYNKTRVALKQKYPGKIDAHMDAMAAITLASQNAGMWVFGENKETASIRSLKMAYYIIDNHLICTEDADESERAWQWMLGWIAANNGRFTMSARSAMPILGYADDGYICILKSELSKAMKEQGFAPDKIFRKWADAGRIPISTMGEKRTFAVKGKRINGVQPWVIKIKEE